MKKGHKIFLSLMIIVCIIGYAPFHIYSDEYESVTISTSDILGVTVYSSDYSGQNGGFTTLVCTLNDYYVGTLTLRVTCYLTTSTSQYKDVQFSFNGNYGFGYADYDAPVNSVTSFKNIRSQSLQRIVDDSQQYYFPYESLNFIVETAGRGYPQEDLYNLGKWTIPIFSLKSGDELTHKYLSREDGNSNHTMTLIIWFNKNDISWDNTFEIQNGSIVSYTQLNTFAYNGTSGTRLAKYVIKANSGSGYTNVYVYADTDVLVMPIYCKRGSEIGFETEDFAKNFGLTGLNPNEEQSVSDLDDAQSQMDSTITNVDSYEQQFTSDFTSAMQNVPSTITWSSQFLTSASWVKTQFDNLTDNNVFGSILTFSLILGISTLIIGKVFK